VTFLVSISVLVCLSTSPFVTGDAPVSIALVRPPTFPVFTATQVASFTGLGSVSAFDATAINDNGQVGGTFSSSEGGEPFAAAFLYAGGVTNPVAFSRTSTGNGLNDKGQVVGQQDLTPPFPLQPPPQAFLYNYSNNRTIDIDKVSGRQSAANSINNAGQVTGSFHRNLPDTGSLSAHLPGKHSRLLLHRSRAGRYWHSRWNIQRRDQHQ
jgi:uncharacterized membrane protein